MSTITNLYLASKTYYQKTDIALILSNLLRSDYFRGPYGLLLSSEKPSILSSKFTQPEFTDRQESFYYWGHNTDELTRAFEKIYLGTDICILTGGLNSENKTISKDFDFINETINCHVGIYFFNQPKKLELTYEFVEVAGNQVDRGFGPYYWYLLFDGKAAPWRDIFIKSELWHFVRSLIPDLEVIEHPLL